MNNGLFAQLSDAGSKLLGTVGENRFAFNTALRRTGFDSAGAMKDFKDYQQVQNEEMKNRLAALQLEKMIDSFQARIDGIALRVDDTNDYWDEYTEDSLTAAGFRREGTTFQKDIVTGSTITSPVIRELREIQQYQDMLYETPDLETASGIRNYGLVYDFDAVQALIANATKVVEAEEERVFGTGVREWRAKGGAWAERDEAPDLSKKKEQEKGWQNRGDGLFGKHVGYAPVYKSGYDVDMEKSRTKNIKYKGSGELGRILGYLSWYNMEEGAGYSQVNQPAWDKPLWDAYPLFGNEDWMMEAPSFAGAVDIVVQVVATVATAPVGGWGGAALGAAIGSVDDLLFTALELGTGYIIPEQALLQVGQTVLKAGVQFAAQGAFQGYEKQAGGLMAAWGKDFLGEATVNVLQQFTTNVANGFIDAHSLEVEDGKVVGWHFDGDQWAESVYGERALAGYAGSFARSATQNLLKSTAVGFLGEGANNYNALIKTASALAGEGVGSLIDGEFSINVLNLTDILSPFIEDKDLLAKMDMGLFSMNFARDKNGNLKTTSRINSAGANVGGLVGLARSVAGLTEAYDNIRIGLSGADEKTAIALRGISTNGQEASQSLFDQILSGETTLQEAYRVAVGEIAKTTSTADGKEISLNMEDLNGFELGVVLAHEAMRNGRNDGKEGQRQETRDSVLAHSAHALEVLKQYGPGALSGRMGQEAMIYAMMQSGEVSREDFEAYIDGSYDSSADFWRLTTEGNLIWDGETALTWDAIEEVFLEAGEDEEAFAALIRFMGGIDAVKTELIENDHDEDEVNEMTDAQVRTALISHLGVTTNEETGELEGLDQISVDRLSADLQIAHEDYEHFMDHSVGVHPYFAFGGQEQSGRVWNTHYQYYRFINDFYMESEAAESITNAGGLAAWVQQNITGHTFMGIRFPVHREMIDELNTAEAALRAARFTNDDVSIRNENGDTVGGGFNPRLTREGDLSNHALGTAIDFNVPGNRLISRNWVAFRTLATYMNNGTNPFDLTGAQDLSDASDRLESLGNDEVRLNLIRQYNNSQLQVEMLSQFLATPTQDGILGRYYTAAQELLQDRQDFIQRTTATFEIISDPDFVQTNRGTLYDYVQQGFMNQPVNLVNIMINNGFEWGGAWGPTRAGIFDAMHFEVDIDW
jgi:hypothetical protein